ncbi:hypothetical protein [Streptomyces sp. NPDC094468]|uniref:hypothetical protein n=1 Tax=Streptomyces sp. NPDC094468 TaxID=3366066 RepID=UPI00382F8B09
MTADTDTETTADRFGLPAPGAGRASGLAGLSRKNKGVPAQGGDSLTLDTVPDPDAPAGEGNVLSEADRRDLELCERAVRTQQEGFWITGKALDAVANRLLYRGTHATFDDLLEDWGVTLADSSRMRRGWRLAARLRQDVTVTRLSVSHVEALLPVAKAYDIEAAATLYAVLRDALPKVTAREITAVVRELPGPATGFAPADSIREQAEQALTKPDTADSHAGEDTTGDSPLSRAVDQRARQLADDLKRSRIPRRELTQTLTEAFADPDDPQVYRALLRWMKARKH